MAQWEPSHAPSAAHHQEEEKQSGEGVEAWDCWKPSSGDLLWEHKPTLHCVLVIRGAGKLRQVEYLQRMRFQLLVESRDPYPATLGQKKGRQSERLSNSKRAAKGARIAQSLLLRRKDR